MTTELFFAASGQEIVSKLQLPVRTEGLTLYAFRALGFWGLGLRV